MKLDARNIVGWVIQIKPMWKSNHWWTEPGMHETAESAMRRLRLFKYANPKTKARSRICALVTVDEDSLLPTVEEMQRMFES